MTLASRLAYHGLAPGNKLHGDRWNDARVDVTPAGLHLGIHYLIDGTPGETPGWCVIREEYRVVVMGSGNLTDPAQRFDFLCGAP